MSPRPRKRGNNRSNKSRHKRGRQGGAANQVSRDGVGFWGDPSKLPLAQPEVRLTEDPSAVVRSLGPPPLAGHEDIAEHYFAAVYDRAVSLAGALAAAGGLIGTEELPAERGEP
jgi:hypothetical protein